MWRIHNEDISVFYPSRTGKIRENRFHQAMASKDFKIWMQARCHLCILAPRFSDFLWNVHADWSSWWGERNSLVSKRRSMDQFWTSCVCALFRQFILQARYYMLWNDDGGESFQLLQLVKMWRITRSCASAAAMLVSHRFNCEHFIQFLLKIERLYTNS